MKDTHVYQALARVWGNWSLHTSGHAQKYSHFRKHFGSFLWSSKYTYHMTQEFCFWEVTPTRENTQIRTKYAYLPSTITHIRPNMETGQMSTRSMEILCSTEHEHSTPNKAELAPHMWWAAQVPEVFGVWVDAKPWVRACVTGSEGNGYPLFGESCWLKWGGKDLICSLSGFCYTAALALWKSPEMPAWDTCDFLQVRYTSSRFTQTLTNEWHLILRDSEIPDTANSTFALSKTSRSSEEGRQIDK